MTDKINKEDTIICRCEDVSLADVEAAVESGITHPEELKRFLHVGMGPCQGRTCGLLITRILKQRGGSTETVKPTSQRPPFVSVPIKNFIGPEDE